MFTRARRAILYEARPAHAFSEAARTALYGGGVDAVSLFSPRTAETFADLIQSAGLAPKTAKMDALCLSVAVADKVRVLSWRSVRVAARPNQDALLDCIDELALRVHADNLAQHRFNSRRLSLTDDFIQSLPLIKGELVGVWGSRDATAGHREAIEKGDVDSSELTMHRKRLDRAKSILDRLDNQESGSPN